MSNYYVVKKPDASDILAGILITLIVIGIIALITVYIGLIFLAIIGIIAGGVALIYALVVFIKSFIATKRSSNIRPTNLKTFYACWHKINVGTCNLAFSENKNISRNTVNRAKIYRALNPVKYFMLFFALFLFLGGLICILAIGIFQYLLMAAIGLSLIFIFVLMVLGSIFISFFISLGIGIKYLVSGIKAYHPFGSLKLSTYSYFKDFAYEIKEYWVNCIETIRSMSSDVKYHAKKQWSNVSSYVIYSPMKYYFVASPLTLFFNIPVVAILFLVTSLIIFIILSFIKLICCLITLIMKH